MNAGNGCFIKSQRHKLAFYFGKLIGMTRISNEMIQHIDSSANNIDGIWPLKYCGY